MTAIAGWELRCDRRNEGARCPRRVILIGALDDVRRLAEVNGWEYDGKADWCPDHATHSAHPVGGMW